MTSLQVSTETAFLISKKVGRCGLKALTTGELMSDNSSSSSGGGIGFVGVLTIVFITLKLLGKIDWSWWWVLSPIWISIALAVLVFGLILGGAVGFAVVESVLEDRQLKKRRERLNIGARRATGRVIDVGPRKDKSTFIN